MVGLDPETPFLLGQPLPVKLCHQMELEGEPKVRREGIIFFLFFFFFLSYEGHHSLTSGEEKQYIPN